MSKVEKLWDRQRLELAMLREKPSTASSAFGVRERENFKEEDSGHISAEGRSSSLSVRASNWRDPFLREGVTVHNDNFT